MATIRVEERGNGWPDTGDLVYDAGSDQVYRIICDSAAIHTGRPGNGNYCYMEAEHVGPAADLTDAEWDNMVDCGVSI